MNNTYEMAVNIKSKYTDKVYRITKFKEFNVELDISNEAGGTFDFIIPNVNGRYSGYFHRFDVVSIFVNKVKIMAGVVDKVTYNVDEDSSEMRIEGRPKSAYLIDSDKTPQNINSCGIKSYITKRCKAYGITAKFQKGISLPAYKKLKISTGQSELNVFTELLKDRPYHTWFLVDTFYVGTWNYKAKQTYDFILDGYKTGIPLKSIELVEDGTDMISQIKMYGTNKKGNYVHKCTVTNDYFKKKKVYKIKTEQGREEFTSSQYKSYGTREMKDSIFDSVEWTLTVSPNKTYVYMPNKTCGVKSKKLGIARRMFIKKVSYRKTVDDGSEIEIVCIPADSGYNIIWKGKQSKSIL